MKLEGHLIKSGRFWAVEFPALGIHTQGKSKAEAYEMAKDAIEVMVDKQGFSVDVDPYDNDGFVVTSKDIKSLIGAILKRHRLLRGLTAKEVAVRMNEKSVTGYMRYERGESLPSFEKFSDLMIAIDPENEPILKIG